MQKNYSGIRSEKSAVVNKLSSILVYVFLTSLAIVVLYPLLWTFLASVRPDTQFALNPWGIPKQFDLSIYREVWIDAGIARNTYNSLLIAALGVVISLILCLLASYPLARMRWKGAGIVLAFFLSGIMIPVHSTLIPLYVMLRPISKVLDERFALLIPYIVFSMPVAIFLIYNYMKSIPMSLEEAAVLDGCSLFQSFIRIIVPTVKPAIATVSIFSFMGMWNELLFALVFLQRQKVQTLPLGILRFTGLYTVEWQATLAAIMIAVIPSIILYVILQEKLIQGMTEGSLKG